MLNLKLDKKFTLKADNRQYVLMRKNANCEKVEGYFSSIRTALDCYIDYSMRHSNAQDIPELLNVIKMLRKQLETALKPLKIGIVNEKEGEKCQKNSVKN